VGLARHSQCTKLLGKKVKVTRSRDVVTQKNINYIPWTPPGMDTHRFL